MSPEGVGRIEVKHGNMTALAGTLARIIGRPVVDLTGLTARYDFDLEYARDDAGATMMPASSGSAPAAEFGASVFSSIQRLGLKLEMQKPQLDAIVIEPSLGDELNRLREWQRAGRHADALRDAQALMAAHPQDPDLALLASFSLRHLKRVSEALALLERMDLAHARLSRLHQERGMCYVALKDAPHAMRVGAMLRAAGVRVLVYPDADKIGKQIKYADSRTIPYVAILGSDEISAGTVTVKDLAGKTQQTYDQAAAGAAILEDVKRRG